MAASMEQLTQQVIQLGNDLQTAQADIRQLRAQLAQQGGVAGGGEKLNHIIDETIVPRSIQERGRLEGMARGVLGLHRGVQ